jgi:hypothetical protein
MKCLTRTWCPCSGQPMMTGIAYVQPMSRRGLRIGAEFRNFGWCNEGDSITSKTTAGYLTSALCRVTGEVDHHWEPYRN